MEAAMKQANISIEDAESLIIEICERAGIHYRSVITQDGERLKMSGGTEYDVKLLRHFHMELTA